MGRERASIFDAGEPRLDVSAFAPKTKTGSPAPPPEEVRAVSQSANFRSREATDAKPESKSKRSPRQHRTGRNVQFNIKAKLETVDDFYRITDAHPGWVLGYTLERAVAALKRELASET
ncbi:MAG: hypothetical protein WBY44_16020 [Bryobacteraceae bacterium]